MTKSVTLTDLPPRDQDAHLRTTGIDAGRIRLCDDLLVSVNRSWQAVGPAPEPPAAEFKAMAPVAFWCHGGSGLGDIYFAAIAPHDAWWLGFEAESAPYAVIPAIDGRNAVTGQEDSTTTLTGDPPDYLLVPDQPWFDAIRDADGLYHQLVPSFGPADKPQVGAEIRLRAFRLADDALTPHRDHDPDKVQPLYGSAPGPAGKAHPWQGRTLSNPGDSAESCGLITILLVTPGTFQTMTGKAQDPADFIDRGDAPEPFDPFQ